MAATAAWKPSAEDTGRVGASNGTTGVPAVAGAAAAPAPTRTSARAQTARRLFTEPASSWIAHPHHPQMVRPVSEVFPRPRVVEYAHRTGPPGGSMHQHSLHEVRPDAYSYVWDNAIEPALSVASGEDVLLHVRDAGDEQITA